MKKWWEKIYPELVDKIMEKIIDRLLDEVVDSRIAKSAIKRARAEGIKAGLLRPITLWPFPKAVFKKHAAHARAFLDVELNMGQMIDDVRLSIECARPVEFAGRTGGMIITPDEVLAKLREMEVK